jgi:hypothetical protein
MLAELRGMDERSCGRVRGKVYLLPHPQLLTLHPLLLHLHPLLLRSLHHHHHQQSPSGTPQTENEPKAALKATIITDG